MNEEIPIFPVLVGAAVLAYFGFEVNRRRNRLREIFNVVDKEESRIAEALEAMVERGELIPYVPGSSYRVAAE